MNERSSNSELAYYLKISNHLAGKLDIHSALKSVKSEISQILRIDHLDVCLIEDNNIWNTTYEVGLQTSWSETHELIDVSPVRDILTGKTDAMVTGNALKDERYIFPGAACGPIIRHQLRSRVNVAMKVLGKTIGALNCSSQTIDFYDDVNVGQVRVIADILAPYFFALSAGEHAKREEIARTKIQAREEGLRQGALSLTDALETERQRIGMDLHDQTLADLTRIARNLKPGITQAENDKLQKQIQNCIQGLRDIIDTSIPSILELFGFHHAVQTHLERAIGSQNNISFQIKDDTQGSVDKLPDTTRIAVFRILQEAINNAVQHSGASQIIISSKKHRQDTLTFLVSDNGRFKYNPKKTSGGLMHIGTRARLIDAVFNIETNNGTHIHIKLPYKVNKNIGDRI